jgi:signal transduction histidine kinase
MKDGLIHAHFDKRAGLLSDSIRTLHLDSAGVLWIGTQGGGLSRWNQGRLATFTSREGLPDNTISQILEDDSGRLWLGCNRGICAVQKRELEELTAGKVAAIYPQIYGRAEGMLSEECVGGFFPSGLRTKAGLLWFSTLKGLVMVNPRPLKQGAPAPAVMLENLIVDGVEARLSARQPANAAGRENSDLRVEPGAFAIRIAPGNHRLEFHYTGLSFAAPERVRFRYRLQGLDPDWIDADTRRVAFYSYVPPGDYRFQVVACNGDGVWNLSGASVGLTVSQHLWQAWWFISLMAIGFVGAAAGIARFAEKKRMQRHLKLLEQERALERERARIARDLHDDLGSSLTRISLLSHLAKADKDHPSQVEHHAVKISQSAAQTVRALEEIVWAIRPGSDSLQSLVEYIAHFANELFEGNTTRCRLDLPHDLPARALPPEMRHNLFLIVKEALTNALKHAGAKEVRVQAKTSGNSLEITVQDDGRGFAFSRASSANGGHGLENMHRRAEAMGGALAVESAPAKGTTIKLAVKLPAAAVR